MADYRMGEASEAFTKVKLIRGLDETFRVCEGNQGTIDLRHGRLWSGQTRVRALTSIHNKALGQLSTAC